MGSLFRILGPLEVEGAPPLGGKKPRTVLARLLLEPNRAVPADALIDAVWGDDPPAHARHALQVYVSSLRRSLGTGRIRAEGGGYAIGVEEDELDLLVFERLVERRSLAEALTLWRGSALADITPALETERARLDELRLAAIEERVEADLAFGRQSQLVAELEALTAEHPLRERFHAQLMLALYRSRRQADALAAYRRARSALDELGIEPTPDLRELETAILRQDTALDLDVPESPRRRLPAPATMLVGRRREVGEIRDAVERGARLVTLTGPGGIGKTRLAIEVASGLAERFRDGVTFISLGALRDHALVPAEIASALGLESPGEATEAIAEHLVERNALLVVDNFEQVDEAAPVLAEILAGGGQRHPARHEPKSAAHLRRARVRGRPAGARARSGPAVPRARPRSRDVACGRRDGVRALPAARPAATRARARGGPHARVDADADARWPGCARPRNGGTARRAGAAPDAAGGDRVEL